MNIMTFHRRTTSTSVRTTIGRTIRIVAHVFAVVRHGFVRWLADGYVGPDSVRTISRSTGARV